MANLIKIILEKDTIDTPNTNTWPLTCMVSKGTSIKGCGVKLVKLNDNNNVSCS